MKGKIRIGTRGSKLALWQAYYVEGLLQKRGIETEIVTIETKGDKILDVSISKIGSKGVFTQEIEDQLKFRNIDIAVHSAKDMQSELPEGFEIIAFSEREKENDVFVSHNKNISFDDGNVWRIGTSSTRRVAMLRHFYPHLKTVEMRGNLQTRIKKMESGDCDVLMLAYAGVYRMGYLEMILKILPLDKFTPAVGQGSIAIECSGSLEDWKRSIVREAVNHQPTEYRLLAERSYLKKLQGGCSIPVFAIAELEEAGLKISGGLISLDGSKAIRKSYQGSLDQAAQLGHDLGNAVLEDGGKEMLDQIKRDIKEKTFYI
ncbi:MAG: hydroxymethylbilane synthase [Bacteroidota bacterium]|nr:hydroxymethylbilane synthase [Bacteroidota bacterium]